MNYLPRSPAELERIQRIHRKLHRNDPLRPIADALLAGLPLPDGFNNTIVEALESRSIRRYGRALAIWAAGVAPLDPEASHRANLQLASILRKNSRAAAGGAAASCATCCAIAPMMTVIMPFLIYRDNVVNELREMAAVSMGRNQHAWNFYPLCEIIAAAPPTSSGATAVRGAAVDSLAEILRRAGPPPAGALNASVQYALCNMLPSGPVSRRFATLDILRIAGSSSSIRALQRYVQQERDPQLLAAAHTALKALLSRQALEQQRSSLLRPAEAPVDPGTLLRPATNQENTDQTLLLRPGERPE